MKLFSKILVLVFILGFCFALTFSTLFPQLVWLVNAFWGISFFSLLAVIGMNLKSVLGFLFLRSTRRGANLAFVVFLVMGILVFLNVLAKQYNWRLDITKSRLNTLSPQTVKILKSLPVDVKLTYFQRAEGREKAESLFRQYAYYSGKFHYEIVDPNREPTRAQNLGVNKVDTAVLTASGSAKQIKVDGSTEEKLTNGIVKLLKTKTETIYFTVGHGERSLDNMTSGDSYGLLRADLEKEGYLVKDLNLFSVGKIPEDAAVLAIVGPKSAFFPKEIEIVDAWMKAGGNALFALDLDVRESGLSAGGRQIAEMLKGYGVEMMDKMLVDPTSKAANVEPQVLMAFAEKSHPITKDFPSSTLGVVANFLFPLTTYIKHEDKPDQVFAVLAKSSASAWAASDWSELKSGIARFHEGKDAKGPLDLAAVVERKGTPSPERFAIFPTSAFAMNGVLRVAGNRDLFLNTMAWLGSQEQLISIRPKTESDGDQLSVNANLLNFVFLITVLFAPAGIFVAGVWVWWRRRNK